MSTESHIDVCGCDYWGYGQINLAPINCSAYMYIVASFIEKQ